MGCKLIWLLVGLAVGVVVIQSSGCCGLRKVCCGMKEEITAPLEERGEPEAPSGGSYFLEVDRKWKLRHPEYDGHYGAIHYQGHNGDGKCQSDEIVRVIPKDYPYARGVGFSKPPYKAQGWERVLKRIEEEEDEEDD